MLIDCHAYKHVAFQQLAEHAQMLVCIGLYGYELAGISVSSAKQEQRKVGPIYMEYKLIASAVASNLFKVE